MRFVNDKNMAKAIAEKLEARETVAKEAVATTEKKSDAAGQEKEEKQDGSH